MTVDSTDEGVVYRVDGKAVPEGSLRSGGKGQLFYYNANALFAWRAAVRDACPIEAPRQGGWYVTVLFTLSRPAGHYGAKGTVTSRWAEVSPHRRPDIDKLARAVLDALTGRVWYDDGQVVQLLVSKSYGLSDHCVIALKHEDD